MSTPDAKKVSSLAASVHTHLDAMSKMHEGGKGGKMTMRDSKGKTKSMKEGMVMETADGRKFTMRGNELWRRTSQEDLFKPQ